MFQKLYPNGNHLTHAPVIEMQPIEKATEIST